MAHNSTLWGWIFSKSKPISFGTLGILLIKVSNFFRHNKSVLSQKDNDQIRWQDFTFSQGRFDICSRYLSGKGLYEVSVVAELKAVKTNKPVRRGDDLRHCRHLPRNHGSERNEQTGSGTEWGVSVSGKKVSDSVLFRFWVSSHLDLEGSWK